ncbi:MAG: HDIG domain-containing metalloprotein [Thermoguttaceae bacterium]|jgi:putative nucleotidyltransferase with HDIG domain
MPFGNPIRTRSDRVAALELPPGTWERVWAILRGRDTLARIGLILLSSVAICVVIEAWNPPFKYRTGYTPSHNIIARVNFTNPNPEATKLAQLRARSQVRYVYAQDAAPLQQLRARLRNTILELTAAAELKDVDPQIWKQFQLPAPADKTQSTEKPPEEQFQEFRSEFTGTDKIERLEQILAVVLGPYEQRGLIDKLPQEPGEGNQDEIRVHPVGQAEPPQTVKVKVVDVLLGDGTAIRDNLRNHFDNKDIADRLFAWLRPQLVPTLKIDMEETSQAIKKAVGDVAPVKDPYPAGATLAEAGKPLEPDQIHLLRLEYASVLAERPMYQKITRAVAMTVMIFTALVLCGIYMRFRHGGPLAAGLTRQIVILFVAVGTVALARWISTDRWRGEILPLLLFGMTTAIVYRPVFALLLTGVLSLIIVMALGQGLPELILLMGVATTAILNLGRIRTRSKLIFVGLFAGGVAFLMSVGLGLIDDQPFDLILMSHSAIVGLWTLTAGFVMTGLLPFIEHMFGILTDLSLLELGDVSHPLLQEMVRRAPSTYNHSITVGSIAEAAADTIGARGLLCRVGAYFHDIGKMLKPGYFIENQGPDEDNRHESLVPAMSTLVIIAHIKDGSDLARQHHLPQPIVDMIAQHHGTQLVEYFFDRAQQQSDPQNGEVDESNFRYPGPKPQTKEAAVLMLADAVESASRTLVDPAPARIESLVCELAEHRLDDGQFDESGLTLRELRAIERSLVMSLTSIYHGRIKYPEQKTA